MGRDRRCPAFSLHHHPFLCWECFSGVDEILGLAQKASGRGGVRGGERTLDGGSSLITAVLPRAKAAGIRPCHKRPAGWSRRLSFASDVRPPLRPPLRGRTQDSPRGRAHVVGRRKSRKPGAGQQRRDIHGEPILCRDVMALARRLCDMCLPLYALCIGARGWQQSILYSVFCILTPTHVQVGLIKDSTSLGTIPRTRTGLLTEYSRGKQWNFCSILVHRILALCSKSQDRARSLSSAQANPVQSESDKRGAGAPASSRIPSPHSADRLHRLPYHRYGVL